MTYTLDRRRGADTRVCRVEIRLDAFRVARQIRDQGGFSTPQ